MSRIAVVDLGLDAACDGKPREGESRIFKEIDEALSGIGFVYLKGHGIPEETLKSVFTESMKFFALDMETKNRSIHPEDKRKMFGYDGRDETLDVGNKYRETFNTPSRPSSSILEKMDVAAEPLVSALFKLAQEAQHVIDRVLKVFAASLQLENKEYFSERCAGLHDPKVSNLTRIKTIFYPYISGLKPGTERCSTHSDFGLLTLLWQDPCGGLEIQDKNGEWMRAEYIPGTILVNTGNLLEYWSSGRYPATIHRVNITEHEVENEMSRQSLAYFIIPDDEVLISPLVGGDQRKSNEASSAQELIPVREYMRKQLQMTYGKNLRKK